GCSAVVQYEHQGDQETDEWTHLQPVEWRKGAQAMTRNSAETGRRRGGSMPCDPELRYHFTTGWQAVGDGRSPFSDSRGRQTASGTAKPDQSPLNQNRSGLCLCHFRKSVDAKPKWDGPNPNWGQWR
ncbi:hypothetical protein N7530_010779, partial [Penicillium desertorum]